MILRIISITLGLLTAALGLATAALGVLSAGGDGAETERFLAGTSLIPSGVMLLGIGGAALWLVGRATRGSTRPVRLPPWWLCAGLFALAVGLGWTVLRARGWWVFFPFAVLAAFAPVAAAGRLGLPRALPRPGWERILPAFAWGALVTPILAIGLQLLAILGAGVAAIVGVALSDDATLETLQQALQRLQGRTLTEAQTETLLRLLLSEPLVLLVGGFILVFAGPVIEEWGKFLAVLVFSRARAPGAGRDSVLTVFLIGLASGLGFALTENIFYAAQAGSAGWPVMALMRGATPLLHGTASALFALGWARQARDPRGWGLLRGSVGAMVLHGAWNLCAGLVLIAALLAGQSGRPLAAALVVLLAGLLGALALLCVGLLLRLRRTLGQEAQVEADGALRQAEGGPSAGYAGSLQQVALADRYVAR